MDLDHLPHLARAAKLRVLLSAVDRRAELGAALDCLHEAVVLLGANGRITFANTAARTLLDHADGVRVERGRVVACHVDDQRRLAGAIANALRFADDGRRTVSNATPGERVAARRLSGTKLQLSITPLRPSHEWRSEGAKLIVTMYDPERRRPVAPALLQARFALTPTEAQIVSSLASGAALDTIAIERGIAELTARSHLKRIFQKLEVTRQTEVVRLALSIPVHGRPLGE